MDRRIVKTKQSLQDALLALLREQPFEQIEIQAITDRANTARVTFYRHYGTKEELLRDTLERFYQQLRPEFELVSLEQVIDFRQQPPVERLFTFLAQDRLLYKKLINGTASALIQQRFRHYIVQEVMRHFSLAPQYAEMPAMLLANHIASTTIGNIMWWLTDDLTYSAEEMARMSHRMALFGVIGVIERGAEFIEPSR